MPIHPGSPFWSTITRFGEAGILLPCAALVAVGLMAATRDVRSGLPWVLALGAAAAVTTASKIAFLGFGVGIASLDFTGFSGHSMFAAAVYPMLAWSLCGRMRNEWRGGAIALAYGLALLVAVSRYWVEAHSPSEIVAGYLLGVAASAGAMLALRQGPEFTLPPMLGVVLALWLAVMPHEPVVFPSHEIVTRMSLKLSGRTHPYTRADLHRLRRPALSQSVPS
jgi:membrane-associated phospholipid phosphatase